MSDISSVPPRIEKLSIQNFRVLRDVHFRNFSPLTVLLGPNGSGKSTFFDVFAFLSETFNQGLRSAVDYRRSGKGLEGLRSQDSHGNIIIELAYREGHSTSERRPPLITYHLEISSFNNRPVVAKEWLRWKRRSYGHPFYFLQYEYGQGSVVGGDVPESEDQRKNQPLGAADVIAVSTLGQLGDNPRVKALRDFITGWHLSHLTATQMGKFREGGPQEKLSQTGDNLVNVIQFLEENYPLSLEDVFKRLRNRIPKIERVMPEPLPTGQMILKIKDAPFSHGILARHASEGTLKMLAYLVQLYAPDPPLLVGIEEPENFLHPKLLRELAEECVEASCRSQLIVTSHSPFFINGLRPEQVWAMTRDDYGYASVRRVADMKGIAEMMKAGAVLGDLWVENYFEFGNP